MRHGISHRRGRDALDDVEVSGAAAPPAGNALSRGRRGRARDDSRDPEILRAAAELLGEVGYDRLTMDAVAALARAGKATLYRRWPSKAELVVDAVICTADRPEAVLPDTGSLAGDLRALAAAVAKEPDGMRDRIMAGLVTALPQHPDLASVVRDRLTAPRLALMRAVFDQAVARGEIPPDRDLDMLTRVGPAMVFHRVMIMIEPVDEAFITHLIDEVILPLALAPRRAPGTPPDTPPDIPEHRTPDPEVEGRSE